MLKTVKKVISTEFRSYIKLSAVEEIILIGDLYGFFVDLVLSTHSSCTFKLRNIR